MLLTVLLSTSIVLFVSVWLPVRVATVLSIAKVTVLVFAVESIPVPPANVSVSESKSIDISPFDAGIYLVNVKVGDYLCQQKIIKN